MESEKRGGGREGGKKGGRCLGIRQLSREMLTSSRLLFSHILDGFLFCHRRFCCGHEIKGFESM